MSIFRMMVGGKSVPLKGQPYRVCEGQMIVVPYETGADASMCVVMESRDRSYPAGGYNVSVPNDQLTEPLDPSRLTAGEGTAWGETLELIAALRNSVYELFDAAKLGVERINAMPYTNDVMRRWNEDKIQRAMAVMKTSEAYLKSRGVTSEGDE